MNFGYMTLKAMLVNYNQFQKSDLQPAIMRVIKCSYTEAYTLGKTHCNMISFWGLLYCQGLYEKGYDAFFRYCLDNKICKTNGYFFLDKPDILKKLNIDATIEFFKTIPEDLKANQFYQIAINDKSHFMAGASADDGNIYLFDTNNRPYGEELLSALKETDKITWLKRIA